LRGVRKADILRGLCADNGTMHRSQAEVLKDAATTKNAKVAAKI
jgi:hypothetical protein